MRVGREAVAERAVADLVVVLGGDDEALRLRTAQLAHEPVDRAKVLEVARLLAGEQDVQLVVEVVQPHRVVTPLLERAEVLVVHLGDDEAVDPLFQLGEHVRLRIVVDRVDGIEAQPVDPVVARPQLGVLDGPLAHTPLRVVDRGAPVRVVPVGEVRAERGDRLRAGADVVVDDVEDHAEPLAVRCVDEMRKALGGAVCGMRREGVEAVVAPVAVAGKRGDGHQLDRRDAELPQLP